MCGKRFSYTTIFIYMKTWTRPVNRRCKYHAMSDMAVWMVRRGLAAVRRLVPASLTQHRPGLEVTELVSQTLLLYVSDSGQ